MKRTLARVALWARARRRWLVLAAVATVAALGFVALRLVLREVHLHDVRMALGQVPHARIAGALALTVVSYLALTGYDVMALRLIGKPRPWRIAATASFASYTISHSLGLSLLTGGSVRYRVYRAAGLDFGDVARVSVIAGVAFWAGVFGAAAVAMMVAPQPIAIGPVTLGEWQERAIGVALLALLAAGPVARLAGVTTLRFAGWSVTLPPARDVALLFGIAAVDLIAASAALFVLVPGLGSEAFPAFFVAFAIGLVVALVSHVPGGLGVFEAVMLATVPSDRPAVFAALLLYRIIYYLLPLLCAAALMATIEGSRLRRPLRAGITLIDRAGRALGPSSITLLAFVGGFILLVSGALPAAKGRLAGLYDLVPLPFIEASHLAASVSGTALLLIAPALNARLRSGFVLARALLLAGALFSLLKGVDYEEATLLLVIAGVLQYCRPAFYREARILSEPIDWTWLLAAAAALALSLWTGMFAYQRTPYSNELWWEFALHGNAPRFLRASFGAGVLLAGAAFLYLISRTRPISATEALPDAVAARALAQAERTDANLAFAGDKSFIVSAAGDAFLMYRVRGRTWVVMGDPIGPRAAWGELLWAVRRACDVARGRLCFYQASEAMLPFFVDLGVTAMKYGEEAHVALDRFTLAGRQAKDARHAIRRAEAEGLSFEVVPAAQLPPLLGELRMISDEWLAGKGGREKSFSLGTFDDAYITRFDCALIRRRGEIVAFANIWAAGASEELSVDLMRHVGDMPATTMDYLFVQLLLWGREQGFATFNLGMAPLSGLQAGRLAPLWAKIGHAVFQNGERFYGFTGLRAFKAKYAPDWVPRYIGTARGRDTIFALHDLVRMVSG